MKYLMIGLSLFLVGCTHTASSLFVKYAERVVLVQNEKGHGTGIFIDSDGTILTCYHVVADSTSTLSYITYPDYSIQPAKYIRGNKYYDLALIKPKAGKHKVKYIYPKYTPLYVGQKVFSIGNPLHYNWSISEGIISGNLRLIWNNFSIQSTAVTFPGSSGSPLFNEKGELMGLIRAVVMHPSQSNFSGISFAIPIETIIKFLETPYYILKDIKYKK